MHVEAETVIERPRPEVYDYISRAEFLPEYVSDFAWVRQTSDGQPREGTEYGYQMVRGNVEGTFRWTEFDGTSRLAWHGPPVKSGPGSMEPSGRWELTDENAGTRVKLVMSPKPGGLFKLLSPLMSRSMRSGNAKALARLKQRLEKAGEPAAG
jgi:uncharacterized protein YndB with AHSA1/START domain